jgi:hypothetical protein
MDQYSAKSKSYSQELGKINKNTTQSVCLGCSFFFFWDLFIITSKIVELSSISALFYRLYSFNANSLKLLLKERLTRRSKKLMKMKSYLEKKTIPFENGLEFNDFHHPYAYDLDIFGEHSLFKT